MTQRPCDNLGTCVSTPGAFTCTCPSGFRLSGLSCIDVDECDAGAVCRPNSICTNAPGAYACPCVSGWYDDAGVCSDIDECSQSLCGSNAINCTNSAGSYSCICATGFFEDAGVCSDVDECALDAGRCGDPRACVNSSGSFNCNCLRGWQLDAGRCVDVDECLANPCGAERGNVCTNTLGDYDCSCGIGTHGLRCEYDGTLAVGIGHVCEIRDGGVLWCWGNNRDGTLGFDFPRLTGTPTPVPGHSGWVQVAAGWKHTCGIQGDNSLWCWGRTEDNVLGFDAGLGVLTHSTPHRIGADKSWRLVAVGDSAFCAIDTDHRLWCQGSRYGAGLTERSPGMRWRFVDLTRGSSPSGCAISTDHELWCWSAPSPPQRTAPPSAGLRWTTAMVSFNGSCGVAAANGDDSGNAWCWRGSPPTPTPTLTDVRTISISDSPGGEHLCATKNDGSLWCWGYNYLFQALPTRSSVVSEPQLREATGWKTIRAGSNFSCGQKDDGTSWCWGGNSTGALGIGTTGMLPSPTPVVPGTFREASLGLYASWAISETGHLSSCGQASYLDPWSQTPIAAEPDGGWLEVYQLFSYGAAYGRRDTGDDGGSTLWTNRSTNWAQLGPETDWTKLAGGFGPCGLRSPTPGERSLWCYSTDGILQQSTGVTDWHEVKRDTSGSACGLRGLGAGKTLWCWPFGGTPSQIGTDTTWTTISGGEHQWCALQLDGSAWCWDRGTTPQPTAIGGTWANVWVGRFFTCGTRVSPGPAGTYCWGSDNGSMGRGQLSLLPTGSWEVVSTPTLVTTEIFSTMSSNEVPGTLAVGDGGLWAWGSEWYGTLCSGEAVRQYPVQTLR